MIRPTVFLLAVLSVLPSWALSESKLSLHLIAQYTPGARQVVAAGPRVLKVLDLGPDMLAALRDYKQRHPAGTTVLRIYTTKHYPLDANPERAARDYWETALRPPLRSLSPADRQLIDLLEGPNECEAYPAWESSANAAWFGRFWASLADHMAWSGFRPCIASIPVGNPPGSPAEVEAKLVAFAPAFRAARRHNGAWSYHAYSLEYGTDVETESWYSLRYRRLHEVLQRRLPEVADLPCVLTEGGIDKGGNPREDGYQARGDAARYQQWLAWFDARLREDPYVLGVTLFQSGDFGGWPSFETEPITAWLASHLQGAR